MITVSEIYLLLVESVENMIFTINARIVRSTEVSQYSIPRADDKSIFVYTEIRHCRVRMRIKNFTTSKIRGCHIRHGEKKHREAW